MINRPFEIGCSLCDHTATYAATLDGIQLAVAQYTVHMLMEHWEDLTAKREEALREDVH
jgi:hypothetical protein